MMRPRSRPILVFAAAGLACASAALAQSAPQQTKSVGLHLDSGPMNLGFDPQPGREAVLSWAEEVRVAGAPWVRVHFGADTLLAGVDRHKGGSFLVITSKADGAKHYLDATALPQWDFFSAYMNGDTVLVELYAVPGMGVNRVAIDRAVAGVSTGVEPPRTICGGTDDRTPYNEPRAGRLVNGCTGWLTSFNGAANEFLTAGHCLSINQAGAIQQFNVPPSTAAGAIVNAPPEFQYPVQPASIQREETGTIGEDWSRFNTNNNSNTGMSARVAQGQGAYLLAASAPASGTASTTVRGYGVVNDAGPGVPAVPNQWYKIGQTHTGPYAGKTGTRINYDTDTDGGNSGSPVTQVISLIERAIGIHTNGGCPGGSNSGTAVERATLQAALAAPAGVALPFDAVAYNSLSTTFASDNGGFDGGAIYFDVTTGIHSLEVTHLNLNIHENGDTSNATATEADDFFNFSVYRRPVTAAGFQTSSAGWTLVATGAGMPKPEDTVTLGALKNTFSLAGNTSYGLAIVFDAGAGHRYTVGTGSNETYSNSDLSITGISASNTPFSTEVFAPRVFNGGLGYHVNSTTGQCLETDFAQNNFGSNGGMVYFNVVVGPTPVTLTAVSTNVGAAGLNCSLALHRKVGTFAGSETNAAAWTQVATASGTSSAVDVPSQFALSNFVALNANTTYGFALRLTTSGADGHMYTTGTGLNQTFQDDRITLVTGSATNVPFTAPVFSPRVWNGSVCYGTSLAVCSTTLTQQQPPEPGLSGFTSQNGGQEEADSFVAPSGSTISGATFWAAYGGTTSPPASQDMIVRFFSNAGGLPGALVATRTVNNASFSNTGLFMASVNKPIFQFNLTFPQVFLPAGTYWVSAVGNDPAQNWIWARTTSVANAHAVRVGAGAWGASAGDFAFVLCGGACYPNCDGSVVSPILNVQDFTCFLNKYTSGDPYANCDGSVAPPVLNVQDFTCFLQKYTAGCP